MNERSQKLFDELESTLRTLPNDRREKIMNKLEAKTTFRVPEVAELLGMTETTVRRKLRKGDLPGVKADKSWRVSRRDLEQWWREQGGGTLFEDNTGMRFAVSPENAPGFMRCVNSGQTAFNSAVAKARREARQRPQRVEISRLQDRDSWEKPVFEIVFSDEDSSPVAYQLDWSKHDGEHVKGSGRELVRVEVELDQVLNACGLEWPESNDE